MLDQQTSSFSFSLLLVGVGEGARGGGIGRKGGYEFASFPSVSVSMVFHFVFGWLLDAAVLPFSPQSFLRSFHHMCGVCENSPSIVQSPTPQKELKDRSAPVFFFK